MILYHGTSMIITKIDLDKSRKRTDFGKGFYLGDDLSWAGKWTECGLPKKQKSRDTIKIWYLGESLTTEPPT